MRRLKALHLITHFAFGGATETTLATCRHTDRARFESAILSGATDRDEQDFLSQAAQSGIPIHILPSLRRPIAPLADVRAYRDLVAWLRHNPWDIVHTHGSKAGILGRLAAARAGVPVIIHGVHGWGHHDHMSPLLRRFYILLERRVAPLTDRLITASRANREKGLIDGIGRPEQYTVIHSGIDLVRYRNVQVDAPALRESLGIPRHAPVVGTVSRLAPQKAPDDFLKVAALVHARCREVHFVFVGGGPMTREFEAGVRRFGLKEVMHCLGYRQDVPALLRVFDVFLLTSLWEGLPRVFPQAMCAQLPIVATCVDGAPEAVCEGETGFLAPPHDCATLADRVLRLLGDGLLRQRMGCLALERVYPAFCEREMARQIEQVYRGCAETSEQAQADFVPLLQQL